MEASEHDSHYFEKAIKEEIKIDMLKDEGAFGDTKGQFLNRRSKREFQGALTNIVSFDFENQEIKDDNRLPEFEEKSSDGEEKAEVVLQDTLANEYSKQVRKMKFSKEQR